MRCPMLLEEVRFHRLRELAKDKTRSPKLLRIFSGGTLEGRKGVFLSLHALALLRQQGIPFHYTFGNHGPDGPACKALARKLGLEDHVTFIDELTGDGYLRLLVESDVFLFPSLRDNSPLTLVEAMAAECLAIVLKTGGPGETVRPDCGVVLELSTPAKTVSEIASALTWAWKNPAEVAVLTKAGVDRVREGFLSSRITDVLSEAYVVGTNR
jgi:colanic acid/amylovoran biosynthesis glycosyltransferase